MKTIHFKDNIIQSLRKNNISVRKHIIIEHDDRPYRCYQCLGCDWFFQYRVDYDDETLTLLDAYAYGDAAATSCDEEIDYDTNYSDDGSLNVTIEKARPLNLLETTITIGDDN